MYEDLQKEDLEMIDALSLDELETEVNRSFKYNHRDYFYFDRDDEI